MDHQRLARHLGRGAGYLRRGGPWFKANDRNQSHEPMHLPADAKGRPPDERGATGHKAKEHHRLNTAAPTLPDRDKKPAARSLSWRPKDPHQNCETVPGPRLAWPGQLHSLSPLRSEQNL